MSTKTLLLLMALAVGVAQAATINVGPSGSIQTAINGASNGDTVVVAMGTYFENLDFLGKAITVKSINPNHPGYINETLIVGDGTTSVVKFTHGETTSSVLTGFTILDGVATNGGGIYIEAASPTITRCRITSNEVTGYGGGIFVYGVCAPVITRNEIEYNTAGVGGGIMVVPMTGAVPAAAGAKAAKPLVAYNTMAYNGAEAGGGIALFYSNATVRNNLVYRNGASTGPGGGIVALAASAEILSNTIAYNESTPSQQGAGGGIMIESGTTKVSNCIIAYNTNVGVYLPHGSTWNNMSYCAVAVICGTVESVLAVWNVQR